VGRRSLTVRANGGGQKGILIAVSDGFEYASGMFFRQTGRPGKWKNVCGHFSYQHIQPALFFGFHRRQLTLTQWAYVASPEKALLDLVYLTLDAGSEGYIRALRLQNLDQLNMDRLAAYVERAAKPKLKRALFKILEVASAELTEYVPL
jgi:predicted transcriptional regulator of viral defense system